MKTAIIQLDPHDDAISTRDHMAWHQAQRVLLVWPGRSQMLDSRLDLTLIHRHAQKVGVEVAVVASAGRVKQYARELGIPVFRSVRAAQRSAWRKPRPTRRSLRWFPPIDRPDARSMKGALNQDRRPVLNGLPRVGVFSLGVLAVLAMLIFFLPGAEVSFTPALETQSLTLTLRADPNLTSPTLSGGLPAQPMTVIVEGQEQGEATGWDYTPLETATGSVVFTNLTDRMVSISAGTIVRTAGDTPIRFVTSRAGTIRGEPGATLTLPVEAQQAGKTGNVLAGEIRIVEGVVGSSVRVTNPSAITGGSDRSVRAPSEEDYRRLEARLLQSLESTAIREIEARLGVYDRMIPDTLRAFNVIQSERDPAIGSPAERISLRMQVEFEVWTVSAPHIEAIANAGFHSTLLADYQVVPDSFHIEKITPVEGGSGNVPLQVQVSRQIHAGWSEQALIRSMLGRPVADVSDRLGALLPLEGDPAVRMIPSWWKRMPFLSFRIDVEAN